VRFVIRSFGCVLRQSAVLGSCNGEFLLSRLEFGNPYGLLSSVRSRVHSLLCAESSIANIKVLCWIVYLLDYFFINKDFVAGREL
jgi:hypothetical protein